MHYNLVGENSSSWDYDSVVEYLPVVLNVLSLIPSTDEKRGEGKMKEQQLFKLCMYV